jgi:hypothetical protein
MTAFVRTASGDWSDPSKWNIGAGYPDGVTDTADLATFTVDLDVDVAQMGDTDINAGVLTIGAARSFGLEINKTLDVPVGATLNLHGTVHGDIGGGRGWLVIAGTYNGYDGLEFHHMNVYVSKTMNISDLVKDCSDANSATNQYIGYVGGDLTVDQDIVCINLTSYQGTVQVDAGRIVSFANGGACKVEGAGILLVNGTITSPVTFTRYGTGSWHFYFLPSSSIISYLRCEYNSWWMGGDASTQFLFTRRPRKITPLARPAVIDNDVVLGRGAGRVHIKANEAAIIEIEGIWAVADHEYDYVDKLLNDRTLIGLSTDEVHLPGARILAHDYERDIGLLYWPYTITLVEDV